LLSTGFRPGEARAEPPARLIRACQDLRRLVASA
jgi:hypothetical protein